MWPWAKKKQPQARTEPYWRIETEATGGPDGDWTWIAWGFGADGLLVNRLDCETEAGERYRSEAEALAAARQAIRDEHFRTSSRKVTFVTMVDEPER
jgi:hypothetical protein